MWTLNYYLQEGNKVNGEIIVHTGPMFSGKTLALLSAYERATIAHKRLAAFKPLIDDRFGDNLIKSRRFGEAEAINIRDISEIQKYDVEVYIIDEFQFLEGDVNIIRDMADNGKRFHIAGLDMTAEGKPFGLMPQVLSLADRVEKCTAVCADCGEDAIYSFFLGKKNADVVVGNNEYIPLCRSCWKKRMKMKEQNII